MSYPYTEDQLVEQPAIGLFAELGWTTVSQFGKFTIIRTVFSISRKSISAQMLNAFNQYLFSK